MPPVLSPTWGEIDSPVTITGTNFGSTQGSSTVTFNGTAATPTSWSATSIATTVPDGATTGNVVVTVSSVGSNGVNFTVSSGGGSDSSGVYYYFSDQLGTARVITDANGNVCYDGDLYPYGGERAVTDVCDSNYKFTGKERDDESGLDNFGARYDSWQYGRFMTPDWSAKPLGVPYATLGNPQSLNLYSYVMNNPLTNRDLDGHWCFFGLVGASCHQAGSSSSEMAAEQQQNISSAQKQTNSQNIATRVVMAGEAVVNGVLAYGKVQTAEALAAAAPETGGATAVPAAAVALSAAGNLTAAGVQAVGAVTGETDKAAEGAKVATTVVSPTGFLTLTATHGNLKQAERNAGYEAILTTKPSELFSGSLVSVVAKVIDYIQSATDALSH